MRVFNLFTNELDSDYRRRIKEAVQAHGDRFKVDDNGNVTVDLNSESFQRSLRESSNDFEGSGHRAVNSAVE